jgi:hypothetical protein
MKYTIVAITFFAGGVGVGILAARNLIEKSIASKRELEDWVFRLRAAAVADVNLAKEKVNSLIKEIEQKL